MRPAAFIGAGIGYRRAYHNQLLALAEAQRPALLEVIPSHFFADEAAIAPLAERYPILFHEVGFSLATAAEVDKTIIARMRALTDYCRPLLFSEHLALTMAPSGIDIGHLAPVWYTQEMLELCVARISRWQELLGVPVAIENITAPFIIAEADMSECEFFQELVARTGCRMLLDLTNLLINGHNHGFDATARMLDYPLEAVVQVHLAGGLRHQDWWVDSHNQPVDRESLALLDRLRGLAPLQAIIVERDDRLPALEKLINEAEQAARIWRNGLNCHLAAAQNEAVSEVV